MKNTIKKILRWIPIGYSEKRPDDLFYSKDEQGNNVFYPWGYPGEAFYIDKKQEILIASLMYFLGILFALSVCISIYANSHHIINDVIMDRVVIGSVLVLSLVYIFSMRIIGKNLPLYIAEKHTRPNKTIKKQWCIILLPAFQLIAELSGRGSSLMTSSIFIILNAAFICFFVYFLIMLKNTKGYYLSD